MRGISELDIIIADRIRARRLLLDLSQEYLAVSLKISPQQVHKYETARSRIAASRLVQIAEILEVPASYFFGESPEKQSALYDDIVRTLGQPNAVKAMRQFCALPRSYQGGIMNLMTVMSEEIENQKATNAAAPSVERRHSK